MIFHQRLQWSPQWKVTPALRQQILYWTFFIFFDSDWNKNIILWPCVGWMVPSWKLVTGCFRWTWLMSDVLNTKPGTLSQPASQIGSSSITNINLQTGVCCGVRLQWWTCLGYKNPITFKLFQFGQTQILTLSPRSTKYVYLDFTSWRYTGS